MTKQFDIAMQIINELHDHGHDAFIVGGAVRDEELDIKPKDVDIATNAPIVLLEKLFVTHDIGQSKDFGIVCVVVDGEAFEVAQFRTESGTGDGRHPDKVEIASTLAEDVLRRDFTINALAMDHQGIIEDHVGGLSDLQNKLIRSVGNPQLRFQEDALRILRMARFAVRFGFEIEDSTLQAAKDNIERLSLLSIERISAELVKTAESGGPALASFLQILHDIGAMKFVHPLLDELFNSDLPHNKKHHPEGNVLQHTLAALRVSESQDAAINLGILFHDIGKLRTHVETPDDSFEEGVRHSFNNHPSEGEKLVKKIGKDLKLSNEIIEVLAASAKDHMKIFTVFHMKNSTILKMLDEKHFDKVFEVSKADLFSSRGKVSFLEDVKAKFEEARNSVPKESQVKLSAQVNGGIIMKILNIKPGPVIKTVKEQVIEWALNEKNGLLTDAEVEDKIRELGKVLITKE